MSDDFLEKLYETVVLPNYEGIDIKTIHWKDHGKVGLDTWAHYFEDETGREYVLVYEDFPGNEYLNDDLSHDIVSIGKETSLQVSLSNDKKIDNIAGYFTLYCEK